MSVTAVQQQRLTRSFILMSVPRGQRQDGKVVSAGSGCELSELMKRRLESVASTGSSASSGFNEDKSYCDSEEEEEGKRPSPPHPNQFLRNESSPQIVFRSDGMFPPPVRQYNRCSRSCCHPTESGEASVCFLSCPESGLAVWLPAQHVGLFISKVLFQF